MHGCSNVFTENGQIFTQIHMVAKFVDGFLPLQDFFAARRLQKPAHQGFFARSSSCGVEEFEQ